MSVGVLKCAVSGTDHDRAAVCDSSSNPRADRMSLGKRVGAMWVRDPGRVRSVRSVRSVRLRRCETEAVRD